MTDAELDELIANCPSLYHMAERGSWTAIQKDGLLSTTALMDLYGVTDPQRAQIEKMHRPKSIAITAPGLAGAVVRDQIPMSDDGLRKALPDRLEPSQWYELLNSKVFFWTSIGRLHRLTEAKSYRNQEHDVLEINTRTLVEAHRERIWLCPINSGCTKPFPHKRDESIFSRIVDYPYAHWKARRGPLERVVELAVDYSVIDIKNHVRSAVVKRGSEILQVL